MTTLLPLDTWRSILGFDPWHFWQFSDDTYTPITASCPDVTYQHAWQYANAVGRSEIIDAIENAERKLISYLGYAPAPHFITDEVKFPHFADVRFNRLGYAGSDGRWMAVKLTEGYVQKVGVETRTLLATVAVAFSDEDGDGLDETWTATTAVTFTDTTQVAAYFAAADRWDGSAVSEDWRIRPVNVTISGGVATVTGKAWLVARPVLYEGVNPQPLDPTDSANFIATVELYRYYCDPTGTTIDTSQAKLIWETIPHPYWCGCGCNVNQVAINGSWSDPAAEASAIARVSLRDAKSGLVGIGQAFYATASGTWGSVAWGTCRPPDRVQVRYLAGKPLVNGRMEPGMEKVLARFGAAELQRPICACEDANRALYVWQFDLARTGGADGESYGAISAEDVNNPFGTTRGALEAWKFVKRAFLGTGFAVG